MTLSKAVLAERAADRERAITYLTRIFPTGTRVTSDVIHVSKSGMSRDIAVYGYDPDTRSVENVSWAVSRVVGWPLTQRGAQAVRVSGVGMDMCFYLVYTLAQTLYGNDSGYALKYR